MPTLDIHHHLVNEPDYAAGLVKAMDAAGIDQVAISGLGLHGPTSLGDLSCGNKEVWQAHRRFPDRLIPMAAIRLGRTTATEINCLLDRGFRGVKTTRPVSDYDDPAYDEIYDVLEQRGVPVLFHTGVVLCCADDRHDDVSSDRMRPVRLDRIARSFSDLIMIMAHLGVPWHDEAAAMLRFHPNVYADLTGAPGGWLERLPAGRLRELLGWPDTAGKVVFGTDVHWRDIPWAMASQQRAIAEITTENAVIEGFWGATAAIWWR